MVLTVARSFGTPLKSVVKCASLLAKLAASRERHFCLSGVGDSSRRLLGLMDSLLSFRQLSLGGTRIGQIAFGPTRLFRRVHVDFGPLASTGRLALDYDVSTRLSKHFVDSPLHVQRVMGGLLSGTIGFATGNDVTLGVACRSSDIHVRIISANGNVTPNSHRGVFRRFAQLPKTRNRRNFKLKLSVMRGLIALLRKSVDIRDALNRKDHFVIVLPLCPIKPIAKRGQRKGISSISAASRTNRSKMVTSPGLGHILLVSSSQVRLTLATTVLRRRNVRTIYYRRPSRLVRRLHATAFSILLASIRVPTVGNFSLLGLLHTSGVPRTHAVPMVTIATQDRVGRRSFRRRNFTKYLRGPFAMGRLLAVVDNRRVANSSTRLAPSSLGFQTLATFSRSSPRTTSAVVRAFVRRARGGQGQVRDTVQTASISKVTNVTRGLLPLFALLKTSRTLPLLL